MTLYFVCDENTVRSTARICLATILFTFCLGAASVAFQGEPNTYLVFVVCGAIGVFVTMCFSW
jgi:hypothetical protein